MMKSLNIPVVAKIIFGGALLGLLAFLTQDKVTFHGLFVAPIKTSLDSGPQFETIELPAALQLYNSKDVLFLDVREKRSFDYGSIQGALSLAPEILQAMSPDTLKQLKGKRALVIYCSGIECGTAFAAARDLTKLGFNNVYVYGKGWSEWESCHLPITMSEALKKEESIHE